MKTKYLSLQKRQTNLSIFAAFFALTETLQYMHFSSCHAPGVAKGFIKGKALRLLRTNSSFLKHCMEVFLVIKLLLLLKGQYHKRSSKFLCKLC